MESGLDYTAMDFWWKAFITVINLAIGAYLFWERHNDETKRRIDSLENAVDTRMDEHSQRMASLESDTKHMPTHSDIGRLYERVTAVDRSISRMEGEYKSQSDILRMILNQIAQKGMK